MQDSSSALRIPRRPELSGRKPLNINKIQFAVAFKNKTCYTDSKQIKDFYYMPQGKSPPWTDGFLTAQRISVRFLLSYRTDPSVSITNCYALSAYPPAP